MSDSYDHCESGLIGYLPGNLSSIDEELLQHLQKLRASPDSSSLERLMKLEQMDHLVNSILRHTEGSDGALTVAYLHDVSCLLTLVSAVREGDLNRHLQAEQQMIYRAFAFYHPNYARYCSYQHVYLQGMKTERHPAYLDLMKRGFGASLTGDKFSAIHGDLVTEPFNKECKGTSGPFRAGFSTNIDAVNTWVKTIHIHSLVRSTMRKQLQLKTSSKHKEMTEGMKKKHADHVRKLKSKLDAYGIDPFDDKKPKSIITGLEINEEVAKDMLNVDKVGKALFSSFVNERLVKGEKSFFDPIKRTNLKTGIVKKKKSPKAIEVLKEDCQAFGIIIAKCISMEEAFKYPITTFPLSIATTEGMLRQGEKASLRNFLISQSSGVCEKPPTNAAWIVDGMAAVRSFKAKQTYREWIDSLLIFLRPPKDSMPASVAMINDNYAIKSVKDCTRIKRGNPGIAAQVQAVDQHMLQGTQWQEFLHNKENKQQLVQLICNYVTSEAKQDLELPFIITAADQTYQVKGNEVTAMFQCNHEEADTRLVLHAILAEKDVVVVAKDTDVLVLMIWAFVALQIKHKWFLKYDASKYVDIESVCIFLGKDLSLALPAVHALTGCDTTSYFFGAGKVKILQKLLKGPDKLNLLTSLGQERKLGLVDVEKVKEFIHATVYNGKKGETYVETRIRIYKDMKTKTSSRVPPDPDSVIQAIFRCHYQAYCWYRCHLVELPLIPLEDNGWKWDEERDVLMPHWFTGRQMPPSFASRRTKNRIIVDSENSGESESEDSPKPKRRKKRNIIKKAKNVVRCNEFRDSNEGDDDDDGTAGMQDESDEMPSEAVASDNESEWEVSDFLSSDDSCDEWIP